MADHAWTIWRYVLRAVATATGLWCAGIESWQLGQPALLSGLGWMEASLHRLAVWAVLILMLGQLPVVIRKRAAWWWWLATVVALPLIFALAGQWLLAIGVVIACGMLFDPRWLPVVRTPMPATVVYDQQCGLCQRWADRIAKVDPRGHALVALGRDEPKAMALLPDRLRHNRPQSILLVRADGDTLTHSRAVLATMYALGGWYRLASWLGRLVPRLIADAGYRRIAANRTRLSKWLGCDAGQCQVNADVSQPQLTPIGGTSEKNAGSPVGKIDSCG